MSTHTKPCDACKGVGTVPRTRRMTGDGVPDPLDILGRFAGTCDACAGSGVVPLDIKTIAEKKPGYAADMIGWGGAPRCVALARRPNGR